MSLSEVLPSIRALNRQDKLRLIELLAKDVATSGRGQDDADGQQGKPALDMETLVGREHPVWTPYNESEAAEQLNTYLVAHQGKNHAE